MVQLTSRFTPSLRRQSTVVSHVSFKRLRTVAQTTSVMRWYSLFLSLTEKQMCSQYRVKSNPGTEHNRISRGCNKRLNDASHASNSSDPRALFITQRGAMSVFRISLEFNGYPFYECLKAKSKEDVPVNVLETPKLFEKVAEQYSLIRGCSKQDALTHLSDLKNMTDFFASHVKYHLQNHKFVDLALRAFELNGVEASIEEKDDSYMFRETTRIEDVYFIVLVNGVEFFSKLDYGYKGPAWDRGRRKWTLKAFEIMKLLNLPKGQTFNSFFNAFCKLDLVKLVNHFYIQEKDRDLILNLNIQSCDPKEVIDIVTGALDRQYHAIGLLYKEVE
jgi:hypothetical protein